jgi:hypothetical protein
MAYPARLTFRNIDSPLLFGTPSLNSTKCIALQIKYYLSIAFDGVGSQYP